MIVTQQNASDYDAEQTPCDLLLELLLRLYSVHRKEAAVRTQTLEQG